LYDDSHFWKPLSFNDDSTRLKYCIPLQFKGIEVSKLTSFRWMFIIQISLFFSSYKIIELSIIEPLLMLGRFSYALFLSQSPLEQCSFYCTILLFSLCNERRFIKYCFILKLVSAIFLKVMKVLRR
jgi:hypothetical protein